MFIPRFEQAGPDMLTGQWPVHSQKKENVTISDKDLYLWAEDNNKSINVSQNILSFKKGELLNLSADLWCEDVQAGEKSYNMARLLFVQNDGYKNRWDFPHSVAFLDGLKDWAFYSENFMVQAETKQIKVVAQLSHASGKFRLKNIQLYPVQQTKVRPLRV